MGVPVHRSWSAPKYGKEWRPTIWSKMTDSSPNQIFINTAKHSMKNEENDCKRKATELAKQRQ